MLSKPGNYAPEFAFRELYTYDGENYHLVLDEDTAAMIYAPLISPNFTGIPTAPTAAAGTSTAQLATTAFVQNALGDVEGFVPYTGADQDIDTGPWGITASSFRASQTSDLGVSFRLKTTTGPGDDWAVIGSKDGSVGGKQFRIAKGDPSGGNNDLSVFTIDYATLKPSFKYVLTGITPDVSSSNKEVPTTEWVKGGFVDLTNPQSIGGDKTFSGNTLFQNTVSLLGPGTTAITLAVFRGGSAVKSRMWNDRFFVIDESVNHYNVNYFDRHLFVQDNFQLTLRPKTSGLNGVYLQEYPNKSGTFAMLDDIAAGGGTDLSNVVFLTGEQEILANKTITSNSLGNALRLNNSTVGGNALYVNGVSDFTGEIMSRAGIRAFNTNITSVSGNNYSALTSLAVNVGNTSTGQITTINNGSINYTTAGSNYFSQLQLPTGLTANVTQVLRPISGTIAFLSDIPSGGGGGGTAADPTALAGMAATNGVATTFMRSDAAPAINPAIAPTWTASHTFSAGATVTTPSGTGTTFNVNKITGTGTVFSVQAAGANKFAVDSLGAITTVTGVFSGNKVTIGVGSAQASNLYITGGMATGNSPTYTQSYGINQLAATYQFTGAAQTFTDVANNHFGAITYTSTNAIIITNPLGGVSRIPLNGTNVAFTNPAMAHGFERGIAFRGTASGIINVVAQAAAGSYNFNLPTAAGSAGDFLTSAGGGSSAMTWTNIFSKINTWSAANSFTNDIEITTSGQSVIIHDTGDGTRRRIISVNGILQVSAPL